MKKLIWMIIFLSTSSFSAKWEELPCDMSWKSKDICFVERLSVPHGWLVIYDRSQRGGMTFYPDEKHEWKI